MSISATFRPKARIIHTLGAELIKDSYAAIIELVKNAYDADADLVRIRFADLDKPEKATIKVSDNGHGMSPETVTDVWMIPGTTDKLERSKSPGGRRLLGAKGIGRLAAARLGRFVTLETTDKKKETTTLVIDWSDFSKDLFLDELQFDIETKKTTMSNGTTLAVENIYAEWLEAKSFQVLRKELRKLLSPVRSKKEKFQINLDLSDCGVESLRTHGGEIEPFPVLDYFDYRLSGHVDKDGHAHLTIENGVDSRIPRATLNFEIKLPAHADRCGKIQLDLRVFDRDPESLDDLIRRSDLTDESGKRMGRLEARRLLNELSGVGIYREGFRIRPYGDSGYDWLELDKERVQNPSLRIGSDQIAGYIVIEEERSSGLAEKSSREGLFESRNFAGLIESVRASLATLEEKRFEFRRKTGRGRAAGSVEKFLREVMDFAGLERSIDKSLKEASSPSEARKEIRRILADEFTSKSKELEKIQETVARYEGQVTLGKIVGVLMHEGRKPLKYLGEQAPRIMRWLTHLSKANIIAPKDAIFTKEEIMERLSGLRTETDLLVGLFNRVDPLAVRKRSFTRNTSLVSLAKQAITLFENDIRNQGIDVQVVSRGDVLFKGYANDIYIALTNLFDNSIFWLGTAKQKKKEIKISVRYAGDVALVDFCDNGPGIKEEFVESVFEPGFSTKPRGTGLGLSIAGEAIVRNGGRIELTQNTGGVCFRLYLQKGSEK